MGDGWIVIPNWDKFQHYKDRDVPWIKEYKSQLDNSDYLDLTFAQRGLLHDLRLLYLATHKKLMRDTKKLSSRLGAQCSDAQLEALNHAGLVAFQSRDRLAQRREEEREDAYLDEQERDPEALRKIRELTNQIWKPL